MAFTYAGQNGAEIAAALQRSEEAKEELKGGSLVGTSGGSSKSPVAPEQEEVGALGPFSEDSEQFPDAIMKRAEEAFAFGRDYLNGQEAGAFV